MKRLMWVGSSLKDVKKFPESVKKEIGFAIYLAECGEKAINAIPLVGFGSSKILEILINDDGDTYRVIYTVKFSDFLYVLHAFKKKSTNGIATPKKETDAIKQRFRAAKRHHTGYLAGSERKGLKNDQRS